MSLVDNIITWYSAHMNYASITALMAVESSFIPFPSEVVIPPAAFVAGQPESVLCATGNYFVDVLIIVFFGTLGAMIGAIINYGLSVWLGRIIIYKFADSKVGHLCLLSSEKIQKAEEYFREKGNVSTFIGRFIPGIRQLISIPAGLSRMHFGSFLWWTFLGAFIWNCILAAVGYVAAGQMDRIKEYSHELSVAILVLLGAVILYFVIKKIIALTKRK
ncbi:MAG: DedA family protein [Paludibacteraceae bacterium]|nr:DedA family protein [Paludibacteraceae bacterium]MDD6747720.1 DedA family protein [Paludibacteraceae bacterium]